MSDPLAGSDTYDILAGIRDDLPVALARWGRMEQHDLLQTPDWASHVARLMAEAAKEIMRLRALVGAAKVDESFAELRATLPRCDPHPER